MDIYDRIQELMVTQGVNAATVCKNTGISSALMTQWKQRKQNPSGNKLQKIADYFGVSVDYLLGAEDNIIENPDKSSIEMNFYERLNDICSQKNTTVSVLLKKLSLSTGNTGNWKKGILPKGEILLQIADYLG